MEQDTPSTLQIESSSRDLLHELARQGAQRMIAQALDEEVREYLDAHAGQRDAARQRLVVRNGHQAARSILTGVGAVAVRQPRVNDRRVE